jgi:hypothetical protein
MVLDPPKLSEDEVKIYSDIINRSVIVVQIHTDIISRSLIDVFRSTPP